MTNALAFRSTQFEIIEQDGHPWLRGYQVGTALGYSSPDIAIRKIYERHAEEFTDAMTAVVTLPTPGGPQETRIFSLRGCHLLAMFAQGFPLVGARRAGIHQHPRSLPHPAKD
jgi:prophage antirepressor-like protein